MTKRNGVRFFGGTDIAVYPFRVCEGVPLIDVWSLHVPSREPGGKARWTLLSQLGSDVSIVHSAVYINGRSIVYAYGETVSWRGPFFISESLGSFSLASNCSGSLWEFDVAAIARTWRKINYAWVKDPVPCTFSLRWYSKDSWSSPVVVP